MHEWIAFLGSMEKLKNKTKKVFLKDKKKKADKKENKEHSPKEEKSSLKRALSFLETKKEDKDKDSHKNTKTPTKPVSIPSAQVFHL
jgi:hypothetical protein